MSHDEIIIAPIEDSVNQPKGESLKGSPFLRVALRNQKRVTLGNYPWKRDAVIVILFILIAVIAFGLGRLSVVIDREPIRIETPR